jgi:hypothetical protein
MSRAKKLTIGGLVACLLPFALFLGFTNTTSADGEVTSFTFVNIAAVAGGIVAVILAALMFVRRNGHDRVPGWLRAASVLVALPGVFQVVRGVGVLPQVLDCRSADTEAGFCLPILEPEPFVPAAP